MSVTPTARTHEEGNSVRVRGDEPGDALPDAAAGGGERHRQVLLGDLRGQRTGTPSVLGHGRRASYLDFWAEALEQYRRNMDTFFPLYTRKPLRTDEQIDEVK